MRRRDIIYYVAADDLRRVPSRFRLTYTRCNVMRDLSQTKQLDGQGYVKTLAGETRFGVWNMRTRDSLLLSSTQIAQWFRCQLAIFNLTVAS